MEAEIFMVYGLLLILITLSHHVYQWVVLVLARRAMDRPGSVVKVIKRRGSVELTVDNVYNVCASRKRRKAIGSGTLPKNST